MNNTKTTSLLTLEPRIGLGTMSLGINPDVRPSRPKAVQMLVQSVEMGYRLFDTADSYCTDANEMGYTERLIRDSELSWTEGVIIATKGGYERPNGKWARRADPEYLKFACERSLTNLGMEQIQLYFLHAPDHDIPFEDSVAAIAELKREGKIDRVGLSNVTLDQIKQAEQIVKIDAIQNPISIAIGYEDAMLKYCEEKEIAWLAYAPLGGYKNAEWLADDFPILQSMATKYDATPYQIALAWLLALSPVLYPIPGSRDIHHIQLNHEASKIELSKVDRELLTFEALDSDMPEEDDDEGDQLVQLS
jgi:aryl-alcohol dehydrogenase-like predicted oxidoreductase